MCGVAFRLRIRYFYFFSLRGSCYDNHFYSCWLFFYISTNTNITQKSLLINFIENDEEMVSGKIPNSFVQVKNTIRLSTSIDIGSYSMYLLELLDEYLLYYQNSSPSPVLQILGVRGGIRDG